jgi:hypothetical protein
VKILAPVAASRWWAVVHGDGMKTYLTGIGIFPERYSRLYCLQAVIWELFVGKETRNS